MDSEKRKNTKTQLALALAQGISAAKWARNSDVTKMTAYRWAKDPSVRKAVEAYRRRMIDQAIGRMAKHTTEAADMIVRIANSAESELIRTWADGGGHPGAFVGVAGGDRDLGAVSGEGADGVSHFGFSIGDFRLGTGAHGGWAARDRRHWWGPPVAPKKNASLRATPLVGGRTGGTQRC